MVCIKKFTGIFTSAEAADTTLVYKMLKSSAGREISIREFKFSVSQSLKTSAYLVCDEKV